MIRSDKIGSAMERSRNIDETSIYLKLGEDWCSGASLHKGFVLSFVSRPSEREVPFSPSSLFLEPMTLASNGELGTCHNATIWSTLHLSVSFSRIYSLI